MSVLVPDVCVSTNTQTHNVRDLPTEIAKPGTQTQLDADEMHVA